MYTLSRTLIEIIKLLCLSVACSTVFSMMIFQEDVAPFAFVCFVLNFASLLLFLIAFYKNCQHVFTNAFTPEEYWIPVLTSFATYFIFSTVCYVIASNPWIFPNFAGDAVAVENFRMFYRYVFQHTRFLEPMLNREYAFVSYIISQLLALSIVFFIPPAVRKRS